MYQNIQRIIKENMKNKPKLKEKVKSKQEHQINTCINNYEKVCMVQDNIA